jgi:hypothetical protein
MSNIYNQQQWYKNKIKGSFAEEICVNHFRYLEFDVAKCGIEHMASEYSKYSNRIEEKNNDVKKILNKTPDLLVSNNEKAFLVEVKFTSTITNSTKAFYSYSEQLLFDYRYMLFRCNELGQIDDKKEFLNKLNLLGDNEIQAKLCENFIFYVVLDKEFYNSYVHIFMPSNYKSKEHGLGWRNAKSNHINQVLEINKFNNGYTDVVEPIIKEIYSYSKKK